MAIPQCWLHSRSRLLSGAALSAGLLLTLLLAATTLVWRAAHLQAVGSDEIPFRKHTIDLGRSESVAVADINRDGRLDVVSGENWYEQAPPTEKGAGPQWIKHHFRDLPYTDGYIEDLSDLAIDVNGDGYPDIVSCSYWQEPLTWWENPQGQDKPWRKTVIQTGSPVEFAFLVDLLNTGKARELLPQFGNDNFPLSWYEITGSGAAAQWTRHIVSPHSYGHGIGAGDVNGDGLPDLVTSLGHDYGIFWYVQKKSPDGRRAWTKHVIDDAWSQAHALTLVDLLGDGRKDLVTGKRYYAHEHDPGANEPLGVYWYEPVQSEGRLQWIRHVIDYSTRAGGGLQIPVVDIDDDGDLDIVVAGKSGLFLFENLTKSH